MQADLFDYQLPEALIAKYPTAERDGSRLLCLDRQTGVIADAMFKNIIDLIQPNDLIVFNNSRVMAARLYGQKATGAKLELLIERIVDDQEFYAHIRCNHAPKIGSFITVEGVNVDVLGKEGGIYHLRSHSTSVWQMMAEHGHMPLPPYMKREDEQMDNERYQTVYSEKLGSVAAPTAGLHFTHELMQALKAKGVEMAYITLHVGSGTFKPVQVDDIHQHVMHSEMIEVNQSVCDQIKATKARGGRVIAVGTTSVRSLETAGQSGEIKPYYGDTDIFLYPGKTFHVVDAMVTNFHLPKSTLIMLVSAFASRDFILNAYHHAIKEKYRFYSYGDAMFIA